MEKSIGNLLYYAALLRFCGSRGGTGCAVARILAEYGAGASAAGVTGRAG